MVEAMKAGLSREALKGFFTFLLAEKDRHQEDIDMILRKLERITEEYGFSPEEILAMFRESRRFVHF